jgi:uncharacterized protein YecE (DUF72 family)
VSDTRIGISGWTYKPWRGVFYPKGLPQKQELAYASRQFGSIEINGTFYSLQRPTSFKTWHDQTPDDFVFSVKGPRFITHMRKLKEVEKPVANFFASGILCLEEKLGPILWQFGNNLGFDRERFETFFKLLPRDTTQAAALSKKHDERMKGRAWTKTDANRPIRHVVEVRHESFVVPEFIDLLRAHDIGLVVADTAGLFPYMEDVTSDFVYVRLHGAEELYASGYTPPQLDWWASRIEAWRTGKEPADAKRVSKKDPKKAKSRDVYVYFDNDSKVHAPFDAAALAERLNCSPASGTESARADDPDIGEPPREEWPALTSATPRPKAQPRSLKRYRQVRQGAKDAKKTEKEI